PRRRNRRPSAPIPPTRILQAPHPNEEVKSGDAGAVVPVAYAHKGEDSGSESCRIWKTSGEAHVRNKRFRYVGQRQTQADVVSCGPQEGPGASGRGMLGGPDARPGWAGQHLV